MMIPPSYFIFVWYLLFIAGIVPYNPFWWLVIALVVNIWTIIQMMYYRNDFLIIFLFILINMIIKIIPIYYLLSKGNYTNINNINIQEDIVPGLGLIFLYVAFLTKGTFSLTIIEKIIKKTQYNIQHNKPNYPIIKYVYQVLKKSSRL